MDKEIQSLYALRSLENNPDGVFWSDANGNIAYVNDAACNKLGYSREELLSMNILQIDATLTAENFGGNSEFIESTSSGRVGYFKTLHRHKDGQVIPVELTIVVLDYINNTLGCSFVRDLSKQIESEEKIKSANDHFSRVNSELSELYKELSLREEQLKFMAFHDQLTTLPNRHLFTKKLEEIIQSHTNKQSAILFIDIDDFKKINDSMGHSIGDKVIIDVGKRISKSLREQDLIFRFGGDEFIVIFRDIENSGDVRDLSEKVKNCFAEPFQMNLLMGYLTTSIGVSIFPNDSTDSEELLKYADTAMYKAKMSGKNAIHFFDSFMKEEVVRKMDLELNLRNALRNGELFLHFQPQYNSKTRKLRGIETLLRWNGKMGSVAPSEFIPIAEKTELIIPIGEWVIKQACLIGCKLKREYDFDGMISVNISALQIMNTGFVNSVKKALEKSGLNPSRLELEITESLFIDNLEAALVVLNELRKLGISICLDDFGTGYSSLSYLRKLPVSSLKIDKSFVDELSEGNPKNSIIGSMVSLFQTLEIETIAEGVETIEQYEYITETGIDCIQGYLLGKPVPIAEIIEIILKK